MLNRRRFLTISAAVLAAGVPSYYIITSPTPVKPHEPSDKVFLDTHAHLTKTDSYDDLASKLNWGATVLTARNNSSLILRYEDLHNYPGFREIEKGKWGLFTYNGSTGYVFQGQEVASPSSHHVVAIGAGSYMPDYKDPRRAVEEIRKRGGIAVLAHPFIVTWHGIPIVLDGTDAPRIRELCAMADEFEIFSASAVESLGINLNEANERADGLVGIIGPSGNVQKGMSVSDGHITKHVKTAGTFFPRDDFSFEALKHHIGSKNFSIYRQHVSFGGVLYAHVHNAAREFF